jgi:hypothetical protein
LPLRKFLNHVMLASAAVVSVSVALCVLGASAGRVTRSKQRELDVLRDQHEDMVATMQDTAARREAASKQLISHYKGEAERLLTMTQKSKSVAKSNRADMMERENHSLKQRVLDLEEKLLQLEMEKAAGVGVGAGAAAARPHQQQQQQQQQWGMGQRGGHVSEEDALLGNTDGVGLDYTRSGGGQQQQSKEMRMLKKIGRAYHMVTGLKLTM